MVAMPADAKSLNTLIWSAFAVDDIMRAKLLTFSSNISGRRRRWNFGFVSAITSVEVWRELSMIRNFLIRVTVFVVSGSFGFVTDASAGVCWSSQKSGKKAPSQNEDRPVAVTGGLTATV